MGLALWQNSGNLAVAELGTSNILRFTTTELTTDSFYWRHTVGRFATLNDL